MRVTSVILLSAGSFMMGYAFGSYVRKQKADKHVENLIEETDRLVSDIQKQEKATKETEKPEEVKTPEEPVNYTKNYVKSNNDLDTYSVGDVEEGSAEEEYEQYGVEGPTPLDIGEEDRDPYTISSEDFGLQEFEYDQQEWTYYRRVDAVYDFFHNEIDKETLKECIPEEIDLNPDFTDFMTHIRVPKLKMEIELIVDDRPFEESETYRRIHAQQMVSKKRGIGQT